MIQNANRKCMNSVTEVSADDFKSARKFRHIGLIFGFIIMALFNPGCKKDDKANNDEYYVKYEVFSSTIYSGGKLNVVINTENNKINTVAVDTRSPWEAVIGPVNKGFLATLAVSEIGTNYGQLKLSGRISVSKNSSPFAVKQMDGSDVPRTSVQIQYSLDY